MQFGEYALDPLRKDEEFILHPGQHSSPKDGDPISILQLAPASQCPAPEALNKFEHEYPLKVEQEAPWAVRPLALSQRNQQKVLVHENPEGETLPRLIQGPLRQRLTNVGSNPTRLNFADSVTPIRPGVK